MAIRLDAAGDNLSSTSYPSYTVWSWMAWIYISTDRNNFSSFFQMYAPGNYIYYGLDSSGTRLYMDANGTNSGTTGTNLSTGTWYHVAFTRNGTTHTCYLNGGSSFTVSSNPTGTPTFMACGDDDTGGGNQFLGRFAAMKMWSGVALAQADILAEIPYIKPVTYASLHGYWPMFPGATERLADYSGNGRHWTGNGTLTDEDPPPLVWTVPIWLATPPAGGIAYNQTVAGAMTPAAALNKMATKPVTAGMTPSAAIFKVDTKPLTGSNTPAGTLAKSISRALVGGITPTGNLARTTSKILTGILASAGVLTTSAGKALGGTLTSAGALTTILSFFKALTAALTPTGALVHTANKVLTGILAPTGVLSRVITRVLSGSITPASALTAIRAFFKDLTASLTPTGTLTNTTRKVFTAVLVPTASLFKTINRALVGILTLTGALSATRLFFAVLGGTLAPVGTLVKSFTRTLGGVLSPIGGLTKATARALSGVLTFIGTLVKQLVGLTVPPTLEPPMIIDASIRPMRLEAVLTTMVLARHDAEIISIPQTPMAYDASVEIMIA